MRSRSTIDLRCNEVQGFLFSAPKPAAEIEALLREQGGQTGEHRLTSREGASRGG
jgi:hypothetical protein